MALSDTDIIFTCIYGLLIAADLVGNTIVCWIVKRFNSMKTPMNYLLVNLAISDIVLGIFQIPRHLMYAFYDHPDGIAGDLLCKFFSYGNLSWVGSGAGIFTLLTIAWERYNAIMKPLSRFSLKHVKIAIVLSWVFGVLITFYETLVLVYSTKIKSCEYKWNIESGGKIDSVVWLTAGSLLPSTFMIVLYGVVIKTLWCSKNKANDVAQRSLLKSRKRVTKSVITVTAILFVCWTPNLSYYVANAYKPINSSTAASLVNNVPILYNTSRALILLNSTVNPFVYAIQDVRFRRCMKRIVSCSTRVEITPASQSMATPHKRDNR
ncbi:tachykinin-like peptides receptor 86C [Actinia tenebrosa]|uniref:Tachykinin-like peptides receptor 86C n=1 Tax=Actinia tenebrosa TaxID=6105 RepID=A0A6P8GYB6_ACTTE|nr:tachykinin-like peptides receptor 86C [Actinia tenebrosa]